MRAIAVLALLFALIGAQAGYAGPLAEFNAKVAKVNQPYKSALSYLRTGNPGVASLELKGAMRNWQAIVTQYGDTPPDPYADDAGWITTLTDISAALEKGTKLVSQGDSKAGRFALLPVRDHLHMLRQRNGIYLLEDCIHELNAQMEVLYHYRHSPPDLTELAVRNTVKTASTVYAHILDNCRARASRPLLEDVNFKSIMDGAAASAANLFRPIDDQNQTGMINVLRELKSFDVIIFLRWG